MSERVCLVPGDMDGVDLAHAVKNLAPALPVLLISGRADKITVGSFPFVRKPLLPETILHVIEDLLIPIKTQSVR
jgi:FixJ family two-component response regulator